MDILLVAGTCTGHFRQHFKIVENRFKDVKAYME